MSPNATPLRSTSGAGRLDQFDLFSSSSKSKLTCSRCASSSVPRNASVAATTRAVASPPCAFVDALLGAVVVSSWEPCSPWEPCSLPHPARSAAASRMPTSANEFRVGSRRLTILLRRMCFFSLVSRVGAAVGKIGFLDRVVLEGGLLLWGSSSHPGEVHPHEDGFDYQRKDARRVEPPLVEHRQPDRAALYVHEERPSCHYDS